MMPNGIARATPGVVRIVTKNLLFVAPLLVTAALAVGCGDGGSSYGDTATNASTPAAAKTAAAVTEDKTAAATEVKMAGSTFAPGTIDLKVGDTVTFVNDDEIAHTATSDAFDSGTMDARRDVRVHGREGRDDQLRLQLPSRHDRDDQRHLDPSVDQISTLVRTFSTTASVNSVVVECPPRSTVLVPVAIVSSTDS